MKFDGAPMMWGRFHYREIVAQECLVLADHLQKA
jgi:hypothetical protein